MTTFERIDHSRDAILRNLYEHHADDMSEWLGIDTRDDGAFGFDTPCSCIPCAGPREVTPSCTLLSADATLRI